MDKYESLHKNTERYKKIKIILKKTFGYNSFKPYQYQIINNILDEKDVLAVMPTGYGKSLCFQIPPLITGELAIVISPLISLMEDQKMILEKLGIKCCCYNSSLSLRTKRDTENGLTQGKYQIMFITPESLVNSYKLIDSIYANQGICMVAIDEAHCLSSYGFDFRPKYRQILKIREYLVNVPILSVTATATQKVIDDIINVMNMKNCTLIKTSFDRPNLKIHVKLQSHNTHNEIIDIIKKSNGPCIVYCVTKLDTENMALTLNAAGISSKAYHSGLNNALRKNIQTEFMNGEYTCIAATIAFGMGINKSNIRTVIHYGCPQSIESYYQEIGRAGRDGLESNCFMFYKQKDFIIQQKFINDIKDLKYKTVRMNLLHVISKYVNLNTCRREYILNYFGEQSKKNNCNNCDNCVDEFKKINNNDELKLFQVLTTILDINANFNTAYGMSIITLILKGSTSKKLKNWMKNLTYYGAMKNLKLSDINNFIHQVIDMNYLEHYDVGDFIHVLKLTQNGIDFEKSYNCKK